MTVTEKNGDHTTTITETGPYNLAIEVMDQDGRAAAIIFKRHGDYIEVFRRRSLGVTINIARFEHDEIVRWLAKPEQPFICGELVLLIDYRLDYDGQLAVVAAGIPLWHFRPTDEENFNRYL